MYCIIDDDEFSMMDSTMILIAADWIGLDCLWMGCVVNIYLNLVMYFSVAFSCS